MTIPEMAALAREHWKVVNPSVYNRMKKNGDLVKESEAASALTRMEMDTLIKGGISEVEAWQEARVLFIFRTSTDLEKAYNP